MRKRQLGCDPVSCQESFLTYDSGQLRSWILRDADNSCPALAIDTVVAVRSSVQVGNGVDYCGSPVSIRCYQHPMCPEANASGHHLKCGPFCGSLIGGSSNSDIPWAIEGGALDALDPSNGPGAAVSLSPTVSMGTNGQKSSSLEGRRNCGRAQSRIDWRSQGA